MNDDFSQLKVFLSMFAVNLPTLLICVVACIMIVGRWRKGSAHLFWGILGFGLALILCFVIPAIQTLLQQWLIQSGGGMSRAWVFTAFGFVASILHAAIYGCLLAAIFAGRPAQDEARRMEN
jgi:hypothetical protein